MILTLFDQVKRLTFNCDLFYFWQKNIKSLRDTKANSIV